jgi:hypothetical protein
VLCFFLFKHERQVPANDAMIRRSMPGLTHEWEAHVPGCSLPVTSTILAHLKCCVGCHISSQGVTFPLERSEHVDDDQYGENAYRKDQRWQRQAQFKGASAGCS